MTREKLSRLRIPPAWVLGIAAVALLGVSRGGADYGRYRAWTTVFSTGDIFTLRSQVTSPLGIPLTQWSHGPGTLFVLPELALRNVVAPTQSPMVAGWLVSLAFWWAFLRLLLWAARGRLDLVALGAGAAFVGTHAGFYSHAHASESVAFAFIAVLTLEVVRPTRSLIAASLLVGASTALLVVTRSYAGVYALPALVLTAARVVGVYQVPPVAEPGARTDARPATWPRRVIAALCLALPLLVAIVELAWVNRWMTGSVARSAYVYGGGDFHSVDWWHPELLAVLAHPWHGLLVYHPLYAVGLVATVVCLSRARSVTARLLWGGALLAFLVNLYVQSAWFVWWMGTGTFGMRGMAGSAVVLTAALVRVCSDAGAREPAGSFGRALHERGWLLVTATCCLWSFLLLTQGYTQMFTYAAVWQRQRIALTGLWDQEALFAFGLAAILMLGVWRWWRQRPDARRPLVEATGLLLGTLALGYLFQRLGVRAVARLAPLLVPALLMLVVVGSLFILSVALKKWLVAASGASAVSGTFELTTGRLVRVAVISVFVITTVLFARLALRTEARLAAGDLPDLSSRYTNTFEIADTIASYREYQSVAGFEDKKAALLLFLQAHDVLR